VPVVKLQPCQLKIQKFHLFCAFVYVLAGGTYMWHMIERDVIKRYEPGPGTLRIYVVTDGEDMQSPYPYMGMNGMNPLMEGLLARGYKVKVMDCDNLSFSRQ